ncbi:hypothetical protein ABIA38_006973 [Embleya sp. AB8]
MAAADLVSLWKEEGRAADAEDFARAAADQRAVHALRLLNYERLPEHNLPTMVTYGLEPDGSASDPW